MTANAEMDRLEHPRYEERHPPCGVACGAMSGSSSYLTDVALDEDKKFNFGDLVKTTTTSALVSGAVGGTIGAGMYGLANGNCATLSLGKTIARDSALSGSRKIAGNGIKQAIA